MSFVSCSIGLVFALFSPAWPCWLLSVFQVCASCAECSLFCDIGAAIRLRVSLCVLWVVGQVRLFLVSGVANCILLGTLSWSFLYMTCVFRISRVSPPCAIMWGWGSLLVLRISIRVIWGAVLHRCRPRDVCSCTLRLCIFGVSWEVRAILYGAFVFLSCTV